MMSWKTVIFTRYSSEMQNPKSCEDQERDVRVVLDRMNIDATDAVVIFDEAESGTKTYRDKFQEVMAMVTRCEVGILAVDDQARFTRADNAFSLIKDLVYSGGRFISTCEGIDTNQPNWELRVKVMELHNSIAIRELAQRVRRGQRGRVFDDLSAGDFPYGYESYYLDLNWQELLARRGPKPRKGVRIKEEEAKWVRQIFHWFVVARWSIAAIARELNHLGVPNPGMKSKKGWGHQHVRRVLKNAKYIGRWTWGATKTVRNSMGKKKQVSLPAEEIVVRERPEMRIIDQDTWDQTQERLNELQVVFGWKDGQERRGGRPHPTEVYPQSLLGGLLYCGRCGARLWLSGRKGKQHLTCPKQKKGLCRMSSLVYVDRAEQALLGFVCDLLTTYPEWMQQTVVDMRQRLANIANQVPGEIAADQKRLEQLDREIGNLVSALADGKLESQAVKDRLTTSEDEAEVLRRKIAEANRFMAAPITMPNDAWVQEQIRDFGALLRQRTPGAALLLRQLLGKVMAHAIIPRGKKHGYVQLRFHVNSWESIRAALDETFTPAALLAILPKDGSASGTSPEFQLNLGGPTRCDEWAPKIAAMREQGVSWNEIGRETGFGGNAYYIWKRWINAPEEPDLPK